MNMYFISTILLGGGLVLTGISLFSEIFITRQMNLQRYSFVRLLWWTRRAYIPAMLAIFGYGIDVAVMQSNTAALGTFLCAICLGVMFQIRAFCFGEWLSVLRYGVIPCIAVLMSLMCLNFSLTFGLGMVVEALLLVANTFCVYSYKVAQDRLLLAD